MEQLVHQIGQANNNKHTKANSKLYLIAVLGTPSPRLVEEGVIHC